MTESEERPLLRSFPNPSGYGLRHLTAPEDKNSSHLSSFARRLNEPIDTRWADLVLLVCFFVSGLVDAGAYNAYENFASMQTGNTVFAALGVSNLPLGAPRLAWIKSVCSIVTFLLGSMVISLFHRKFGERKRWVLATSFLVQGALILVSAELVSGGHSSGSPGSGGRLLLLGLPADPGFPWADLLPIGLLSFQSAGKVITSRMLEYNGMPCVVLTTLFSDLISDPGLFTAGLTSNAPRNRRAGGAIFYFGGAVVGGTCASHPFGFSGGLYVAGGIHFLLAATWMLWRAEPEDKSSETG